MTTKVKETTAVQTEALKASVVEVVARGECVVDDGRCVGRAVNGKVCSYHAMQYRADGKKRGS